MGRPSPSFSFVGNGFSTTSGVGGGGGEGTAAGVEAFFLDVAWDCGCGVASETRLLAAGSRRSRAESRRFSAMVAIKSQEHALTGEITAEDEDHLETKG